ncbi:GAG-pre-integrase domain [Popillia japonica]|uniref:GAG-pre-integrase domain n=1 Tax=Popillia japonica TaxID=7064 RepID=A0AAW1HVE5_POPJA
MTKDRYKCYNCGKPGHKRNAVTRINQKKKFTSLSQPARVKVPPWKKTTDALNGMLNLRHNLLSVKKLVEAGLRVNFCKNKVNIYKDSIPIAFGQKVGSLFEIEFKINNQCEANVCEQKENYTLWHKRLGHLGQNNVSNLYKNNMVDGMSFEDKLPVDNCETCIRSNITKLPFNSKTEKKTKRPLESPTTCLKPTATPAQMFYQRKPNLKNLKVFGCLAYCHIPKNKIFGKFEPKGESCIMIGYTHNGYRLWNPEKRNVFEARDVIFCEDKTIADFRNTVDDKVLTIVNEYGTENQKFCEDKTIADFRNTVDDKVLTIVNEYGTENQNANEENITQDTIEDTSKVENEKENEDRQPTRTNKPEREHRLPAKYADFEMNIDDDETQHFALCVDTFIENVPNTYTEAVNEGSDWQEAIEKELKAHETLGTWESAELPEGKKAIDTKWFIFKECPKERMICKDPPELPCIVSLPLSTTAARIRDKTISCSTQSFGRK